MDANPAEAQAMLDALVSVGVDQCDLRFTDINGTTVDFRSRLPIAGLRPAISAVLRVRTARQHNVLVRPYSSETTMIQLDDLDVDRVESYRNVAFMVLQTSLGSFQVWLAADARSAIEDFESRVRKAAGADLNASGATRIAGSLNFKEKYIAAFPTVELAYVSPGRITSAAELEAIGVLISSGLFST